MAHQPIRFQDKTLQQYFSQTVVPGTSYLSCKNGEYMALQLTIDLDSGLTATDAYHKIVQMTVQAFGLGATAILEVRTYVNSTMADANGIPVLSRIYEMGDFDKTDDAVSAASQAYTFLKTLPDFTGAIDV